MALVRAAKTGNVAEVERLLAAAPSAGAAAVDARDDYSRTPLHWACRFGHPEVVTRLLTAGAEVDARDNIDRTPLYWASIGGHPEVVTKLLAAGANRFAENNEGETPADVTSKIVRTLFNPPVKAAM